MSCGAWLSQVDRRSMGMRGSEKSGAYRVGVGLSKLAAKTIDRSSVNSFCAKRKYADIFLAAASTWLLTASGAWAACAPAAPVSNTTVTCSGTTTDQNPPNGYGTGVENNLTINVQTGASVSGTGVGAAGIDVSNAVIVNNSGAVSGTDRGILGVDNLVVNNSLSTS